MGDSPTHRDMEKEARRKYVLTERIDCQAAMCPPGVMGLQSVVYLRAEPEPEVVVILFRHDLCLMHSSRFDGSTDLRGNRLDSDRRYHGIS